MEDAKAAAPTDATTATAAPTTTTTTTAAATEEQQQKPATKAPRGGRRAAKDNMDEVILIKEEPSVEDEVTALKELGEPEDGMYRYVGDDDGDGDEEKEEEGNEGDGDVLWYSRRVLGRLDSVSAWCKWGQYVWARACNMHTVDLYTNTYTTNLHTG